MIYPSFVPGWMSAPLFDTTYRFIYEYSTSKGWWRRARVTEIVVIYDKWSNVTKSSASLRQSEFLRGERLLPSLRHINDERPG